ncbi:UDP-N-acetylglucosamine 2-epimerase [Alphaproteobacteria bacterium]|nr:UDP-N-acetylglucosamine 2-epimerase [Alphaproteobacteria bacterium]
MLEAQSKKICVITGSRAEYGLLRPLLHAIKESKSLRLSLAVTGMHLSHYFGYTKTEIVDDGFDISLEVDAMMAGDDGASVAKSLALGILGFTDGFKTLRPDLVLVLGDRYEVFAAAQAAFLMNIPIAHIHGGETTQGAFDEGIRHSITKMSALHFVSAEAHFKRVCQLGEDVANVHNVGALGIENILREQLIERGELAKILDVEFSESNVLVTYHPVTLGGGVSVKNFLNLLAAINKKKNQSIFITYPNSDAEGRQLIREIENVEAKNNNKVFKFKSLGTIKYLSLVRTVNLVIGNSSSALIEVPYLGTPVVDVGDRQLGRLRSRGVVHSDGTEGSILFAMEKAQSTSAMKLLLADKFLYGNGNTSSKIVKVLEDAIPTTQKKFVDN